MEFAETSAPAIRFAGWRTRPNGSRIKSVRIDLDRVPMSRHTAGGRDDELDRSLPHR